MTVFWVSFVVTLSLLGAALWTGLTRRRRVHLVLAPLAVAALAVTVVLTERLVRTLLFPERELAIHLVFAIGGAVLAVPVVATGIASVRRPRWRRAHRVTAVLFLLVAVIATGTGIWVFGLATPR